MSGAVVGAKLITERGHEKKYNFHLVAHLLSMYLDKYRSSKTHIFSSYDEVGAMFPVHIDNFPTKVAF